MSVETTSLANKRILVTGGSTGIGRATVALLAAAGARIVTFARDEAALNVSLEHARAGGGKVSGVIADVASKEGVTKVFAQVDAQLGGLDILINNAGLAIEPAQESDDEAWRYGIETNFLGYLACAREAIPRLEAAGGGHIVFIGSISAEKRGKGSSVYAATKAAVETYSKTLRKEVQEKNIKVTLIEPGSVGADMQEKSEAEQRLATEKHEMLFAEELADTIQFALTRSARTDISVMRVEPRLQKA